MLPVVILAGGLATRLRPITEKIPKSLVEIAGRPFISWQLELLRNAGVSEVVLCTGHLGEMIEEVVGDGHQFGLTVCYSRDGERLLGTGGALKKALGLLKSEFFVLYGDSYLPISFVDVEARYHQDKRQGLMTVFCNAGQWDTSNVLFTDGAIRIYDKKNRHPDMRHIDYGLSIFHAQAFDPFPAEEPFDLAHVMQDLLARGQLSSFEVSQRFYEIGSAEGLEELSTLLQQRPS